MSYSKAHSGVDRRVVRTKKAIRSALFEITETKDISSVTVSELARKAGVNRRTFYTHYAGITDIVEEVEEELVDGIRGIALNFHDNNLRECAYDVFVKLNDIVSDDFDYCFRRLKLDLQGAFVERIREIIDEFAQKIVKSAGNISFEKARFAASFAVGGFITAFFEWKTENSSAIEEAAKSVSIATEECVKGIVVGNGAG
ncbi:MAG: TetR/AcrR family transcriptional regulator [Oscillospiraceae bacterium]|nr:TetR/AcrR family transcriptional regulator [Oscillospiraceae bacterium]